MEREFGCTDNRRMSHNHLISKLCAAAMLCSGGCVLAQTVYKQTDASGVITFSDRPPVDSLRPYATFTHLQRVVNGNRSDVADALMRNAAMSSSYAVTIDFNEARGRLKRARENRAEGMEPRPGERIDSSGTVAMNGRYQRRQRGLQREVVAAERRSHEASLIQSARVIAFLNREEQHQGTQ